MKKRFIKKKIHTKIKNDFPNRHRNHEIEELSERYFKSQIPVSWVVNPFKIDYGTDYNCEITIAGGVSGKNFTVQLKGKEIETNNNEITISNIKRSTINRWLNRLEPTMLIVYIVEEKEAYWIWFENNTVNLALNNRSFTINIPRNNKLSNINWDSISDYINVIFSKKNLLYELPEIEDENEKAWNLYFEKKYESALPLLKDLLKKENNGIVWNAIAICNFELSYYQEALIAINKALEIDSDNSLHMIKANILTEQGALQNDNTKIENAIKIYKKLISDGESSFTLFYNYGCALIKLNKYADAINELDKAIILNPNKAEIWQNLGLCYQELGLFSEEIKCLNFALSINPNLQEALFIYGATLFQIYGQVEEGLVLMLKSSTISNRHEKDFPNLFWGISEAYLTKKEYKKASEWNKNGLDLFSSDENLLKQKERIEHVPPLVLFFPDKF